MIFSMGENLNTSIVEVTDVVVAVKGLTELSSRMRKGAFNKVDIGHIDIIIDALHELDQCKTQLSDTLETETIKCAAVRHKLMHYPDEINREIHEAVQRARLVNDEAIDKLKSELKQVSSELNALEKEVASVEAENYSLRQSLAIVKGDFDGQFARLNELLAEKSREQIRLNEDRELLRQANVRIVELEEDEVRLAEQMASEKQAYRETMLQLKEEMKVVSQDLAQKKEKESSVHHECLVVYLAYEVETSKLEEAVKLNEKLTHEIVTHEVLELDAKRNQAQAQKSNEKMRVNIASIVAEIELNATEHEVEIFKMTEKVEELTEKTQQQAALKDQLITQKTKVKERTENVQRREAQMKQIEGVNKAAAQKAKHELTVKTQELKKLRQEIADMDGRRAELEDAARAEQEGWLNPTELMERDSVLEYNKQIAELKERLEQTREATMKTQLASEKVRASISNFNAADIAEENQINGLVDGFNQENASLDAEEACILAKMRDDDARRIDLTHRLATERHGLAESRAAKESEAERLVRETHRLGQEKSARAAELTELGPKFDEFRGFFERNMADYEALKRSLARLKSRKIGLEEGSQRAGDQIERLAAEIAFLKRDKERRVAESQGQLDRMAGDRVAIERQIYVIGCKLKTVLLENARLEAGISRLDREMRSMRDTWEQALPAKARAEQHKVGLGQQLRTGLQADMAMSADFQENDKRLLTALAAIINDTEPRWATLKAVTDGLDSELDYLNEYLRTSADVTE